MNTVLYIALDIVLVGLGILAAWLVIGLIAGVILGRVVRLADQIEVGDGGDEEGQVSDFVPPPHDIGKSISDLHIKLDGQKFHSMIRREEQP
jgi:hypothetical protein